MVVWCEEDELLLVVECDLVAVSVLVLQASLVVVDSASDLDSERGSK